MNLEHPKNHGNDVDDELQTSSTEDASDQSQNSLELEGPTSSHMPKLPSSNYLASSTTDVGVASHSTSNILPSHHIENGIKTNGCIILDEDKKREHKRRSKNWTRPETLKLIKMRTELDERFRRSGKKAALWDEIAFSLQKEKFSRDGQQCKDKWEKLTAGYKEVRDGARHKDDHPFFEELHVLLSWKSYKKESDGVGDEGHDTKRLKLEIGGQTISAGWNQAGVSYPLYQGTNAVGMRDVSKEVPVSSSPGKRRKREEALSSLDVRVIQEVLDTIIARQQRSLKELLDAVERKEEFKEQRRQAREDKWRAEERAQRLAFNGTMIRLTRRLMSERQPLVCTDIVPIRTAALMTMTASNGLVNLKKRSKNWKKSEVSNLIRIRRDMESKFGMSTRRAGLWDELGEKLRTLGINRDGKQCREKWDKLMAEYKDVMDKRKDKDESHYFAELSTFLGRADAKSSSDTTKEE